MNTSYHLTSPAGRVVGIYATLAEVKVAFRANPDATVTPVVTTDTPCAKHAAFEADNCPSCGTSRMSF